MRPEKYNILLFLRNGIDMKEAIHWIELATWWIKDNVNKRKWYWNVHPLFHNRNLAFPIQKGISEQISKYLRMIRMFWSMLWAVDS